MTQLNDLPPEIIQLIIYDLSFSDALHFHETCIKYYHAVEMTFSNQLKTSFIGILK